MRMHAYFLDRLACGLSINDFRPIITSEGLWDQVRVDCGREFALLLFVQGWLSRYRTNTSREPYLQTRSTQVIEIFL